MSTTANETQIICVRFGGQKTSFGKFRLGTTAKAKLCSGVNIMSKMLNSVICLCDRKDRVSRLPSRVKRQSKSWSAVKLGKGKLDPLKAENKRFLFSMDCN